MPSVPDSAFPRLKLGVSACLLGERVRYDGGHKRHAFLSDVLAAHADYLPICPEAAIGMGVPRPPIHLVGEPQHARALGLENPALDVTAELEAFALRTLDSLDEVSGYIFKKDSPSCGVRRVKVFRQPGRGARRAATGIFARVIREAMPLLPVEEEDGLDDPQRRHNFLCRLYVYQRWQALRAGGIERNALVRFHTAHRYLVMAHSRAALARLETLLADATAADTGHTAERYIGELLTALARPARRRQHATVLRELAGRLRPDLEPRHISALTERLEAYDAGRIGLADITAVMRAHAGHAGAEDLIGQVYLYPYPDLLRHPEN